MTDQLKSSSPKFFGKDSFVPYIGQVEDVNDPKHSNRVKVRIVGLHPNKKDTEEGLKTDDLPWAVVGMPATHAQQSRIGGKHGLLPGCWVWGFFMDGEDGQNPFIVNTFDFTAKASEKDNRKEAQGKDGKLEDSDQAFAKTVVGGKVSNNTAMRTVSEKQQKGTSSPGDPAGDQITEDADDPCTGSPTNKSVANTTRQQEQLGKVGDGREEAQNYGVSIADGLCGSGAHASDDIQRKLKERFPSALSRFVYGDVVWNSFSGNFIDTNGLMMQLAKEICSLMKQPAESMKSVQEEINRITKGTALLIPDRDGVITQASDLTTTTISDMFHGIFATTLIDILCQLVMQQLQGLNNQANEDSSNENREGSGTNASTPITNVEASCMTQTLLDNISTLTDRAIASAMEESENASEGGSSSGSEESYVNSILGGIQPVMQFFLSQKYSIFTTIFNKSGPMSQDILTKAMGCINEREYKTNMGAMGATGGGSSPGSGGGDGSSGYGTFTDNLKNVGFGGYPGKGTGEISYGLCEEAVDPNYLPNSEIIGGGEVDGIPIFNPNAPDFEGIGTPPSTGTGDGGGAVTPPSGGGGAVVPLPLPSDDPVCATNFIQGIPNTTVVVRTGNRYFYDNKLNPENAFPSIHIRNYKGKPIPVVDRVSGELVAILTNCKDWPDIPSPPVTIIPDESPDGITTDDPNYEIVLGGLMVENTGFQYCNPEVQIYDRDKKEVVGKTKTTVINGRIVEVEIINKGSGYKRLPEIRIVDDGSSCGTTGGFGANIYPIMEVIPKPEADLGSIITGLNVVYCPAKNLKNFY